jgi:hypothetical protein
MPAYKRILLKLSGEALMGDDAYGINRATIVRMVKEIQEVTALGCEVAVVIGGGNIFRGVAGGSVGMDRATADYMGMLATVMNSLALADTMRQEGMTARVMSAIASTRWSSLRAPQGLAVPRRGQGGGVRCRHRQPVLHHRHGGRLARRRDRRRDHAQGHQGRRRLHRRSQEGPDGHPLHQHHLRRGASPRTCRCWTPRPLRCAAIRTCRSRCFRSSSPARSSAW